MSLKPLLSFSGGELDPILHDNVTLEKFQKGLATARNVMIGKTGSIISRFSRENYAKAKNDGEAIKLYCPPNSNHALEFGNLYVRVHSTLGDPGGTLQVELVSTYTEADLPDLHFETSKDYVYIFCAGKKTQKLKLTFSGSTFVAEADVFKIPVAPNSIFITPSGTPAGFPAFFYAVTAVINGEESLPIYSALSYQRPVASPQVNDVLMVYNTTETITEMRVYAQPQGGGAYGLLGVSTSLSYAAGVWTGNLMDYGSSVDFGNGIQLLITETGLSSKAIIDLKPKTGVVYQQRLLITTEDDKEALLASRPGYQNNFYRDFPYAADSALKFKAGTSGKADVLRVIEENGLIVFTTVGVFANSGVLSVNNLALEKKGGWIINASIPPLVVPGGVFFVDTSNTIRQLIFSQEIMAYESLEQTIFSNHLFKNRPITSWCYQGGTVPLIIVTFSDGTFATFTYNFEQQMKAWTRHDSRYPIEQVEGTDTSDVSFYVINKDGNRYIERSLPRYVPFDIAAEDPESDKSSSAILMDAIDTAKDFVDYLSAGDLLLTPVVLGDWSGVLTLNSVSGSSLAGVNTVGSIIRWFNPIDKTSLDLEVTEVVTLGGGALALEVKVQPSEEFPSAYASNPRLYRTYDTVASLDHLEGEAVSVISDGYVVASPNNDVEGYPTLTVVGGQITLPDGLRGAIIHVGRPLVADVKTLNLSTVEQAPTILESLTVNKLYIKVNETRGLYCANEFPEEKDELTDGSSVVDMESLDLHYVPRDGVLLGNRYNLPVNKRLEKNIPGSWNTNGQISFRQVDPLHFEILSIIPDVEILTRSNR